MQFHPKCQKTTRFWRDASLVPLVKRLSEPPATTAKVLEFHPVREPQIVFSSFLAQLRIATRVGRKKNCPWFWFLALWKYVHFWGAHFVAFQFLHQGTPRRCRGQGLVSSRIRACTISSSFRRISLAKQQKKCVSECHSSAKSEMPQKIPKLHTFWLIGKPLAGHPG